MIAALNWVPWYVWSLIANVSVAYVEYINRVGGYSHVFEAWKTTAPYFLLAQVGFFYAWRDAPSFMYAWAFFTTVGMGLRLLSARFLVGDQLTVNVWIGVMLILLGGHFVRQGIVSS